MKKFWVALCGKIDRSAQLVYFNSQDFCSDSSNQMSSYWLAQKFTSVSFIGFTDSENLISGDFSSFFILPFLSSSMMGVLLTYVSLFLYFGLRTCFSHSEGPEAARICYVVLWPICSGYAPFSQTLWSTTVFYLRQVATFFKDLEYCKKS